MNEQHDTVSLKPRKRFADSQFRAAAILLVRYRRILALLLLILCVGGLYFARNINLDNSLELWFLEDDPTLATYKEFKAKYGNDEIILAMIDCRRDGMFSPAMLSAVYKASRAIEEDTANFRRVLSVGLSPYIGLQNDELVIEDLMSGTVETESAAAQIEARFMDDPFKRRILQNASSTWAIIIAEPVASADMDVRRPLIIESVRKKLAGFEYRLAGMGVMYDELNRLSIQDGVVFNAVAFTVIAVLIFALYRSWMFLLMALGAMLFSGLSFLGFYGLFDQNFNMVTIVLPTLMMILSVSDVAYVYNNYCFNSGKIHKNLEEGLADVFYQTLSPCLFTSLTNTCGFFALTASSLSVLRIFGWFAGFASITEYLISMIVSAYVLGHGELKEEIQIKRPLESQINWVVKRVPAWYRQILVLFALAAALGVYGITQLNVDTYSMGFLHEKNQVRLDSDQVEALYGNYLPLEVRLLTGKRGGILTVDFMQRLQKTHADLDAATGFEKPASIVDVFKKLNQVWSDGTEATYVVPDSDDKIAQLMMQYESDSDNDLEYMTDKPDYTEARLTIRVPMLSAAALRDFEEKAKEILHKNFDGTGISWKFGGYVPLYARIISYVTWSQISSFALAFVFVFGAIAILFRRVDAMVLVILPNVFPILMTLGVMGLTGIRLDIATVTIAAIALGIVVDDTIHSLYQLYDPSRSNLTPTEAIINGIEEAGPAMVSTSLIYSLGFLFMVFASIKSIVYFGLLLSFTIVVALLCDIVLLPAQICFMRRYLARGFRDDTGDLRP
ncbi:MAG: hypothetical protein CVV41_03805 [Candidatus Riflebacteria bacterium HGW-Riflebacteria-1]|jgi:hypothetical protein|nr:MAG: hypothetical protein CVV41_03805 [Candidatus Riflebacteria bacterium HGW-Riflebacteria-1]